MMAAGVTDQPLDVASILGSLRDERSGALSLFAGVVRNHDPSVEGDVVGLEYSAHPDAGQILEQILAEEHRARASHVTVAYHRTGTLMVGEVALVVAVMDAHRAAAQEASTALVERIKAELPVWKKELLATGEHVWVAW